MVSKDYIVGLTDGEGCFYINTRPARSKTSHSWVETHFYIKVKAQDKPMLEEVKMTLGCGAIYLQKDSRPNHCQCYRFEVNNRRDIKEKIIPLFESRPLHSIKRKEFELFKTVCQIVDKKEHLTLIGFRKVQLLKKRMSQNRGHRAR